jgi:hypothetical protein
MRKLMLLGAALAAGCHAAGPTPPQQYALVVDGAVLNALDHDGNPWCSDGSPPSVAVHVTLDGIEVDTPPVQSATPSWSASTLLAPGDRWADGVLVDAVGSCGGPAFRVGAVLLHPSPPVLLRAGVQVAHVGGLALLRLRFVPYTPGKPSPGGVPGAAGAGGFDYYDYYDGSGVPISDGGVYDDGSGDPSAGNDTSGCGCADPGPGDPGASDPGAGDPGSAGGDSGGTDSSGGDSGGGDGSDSKRITHPLFASRRAR